jgi:hypothetical protein
VYFGLLIVRESGIRCWSSHHRNPAESELSNRVVFMLFFFETKAKALPYPLIKKKTPRFSCYDGCIDNNIGWTVLPQPRRLKWQVIPKAPFASCCGLLFRPSSRCPVSGPSRRWTFRNCWCSSSFLVLEL